VQRKKTILTAAILILLTLFFIGGEVYQSQASRRTSSSVYSDSSQGIHIFFQLAEKIRSGSASIQRKVLSPSSLNPEGALFLLSPKKIIKRQEVEVITDFVKKGGELFLSFETKRAFENLYPLLEALELPLKFKKDEIFKNGRLTSRSPPTNSSHFKVGETYAFYSKLGIEHPPCQENSFDCYALERPIGEGRVLLMAGLPLLSNVLISEFDNRQLAFRILESGRNLVFNEFHHFYSDHTFWGLLKEPSFGLPLISLIALLLLLFLFGHSPIDEVQKEEEKYRETLSFHELNEKVLFGVLHRPGALRGVFSLHQEFLEKIFPNEKVILKNLIPKDPTVLKAQVLPKAREFIELHRKLLRKRKGLP